MQVQALPCCCVSAALALQISACCGLTLRFQRQAYLEGSDLQHPAHICHHTPPLELHAAFAPTALLRAAAGANTPLTLLLRMLLLLIPHMQRVPQRAALLYRLLCVKHVLLGLPALR
jgi:hypothetical protein